MHGDGTKLGITKNRPPPPARLLDITRLISRAGRVPTGIDRVEFAYMNALCIESEPFFAVVRTTLGYVLLDQRGARDVASRLDGSHPWGAADRLSVLARGRTETVRRAESDLRRLALDRCRPSNLGRMLARHLPQGTAYLNTGHSNLTDRMLWAARHGIAGRVTVFIHDTIPLDHPHLQRPGTPERFRAMLRRVCAKTDLIICNSTHTKERLALHMSACSLSPPCVVAPLGVHVPQPDAAAIPPGLDLNRPYFLALGTIEPRKGHGLLLDLWDTLSQELGPDTPRLFICGVRGWADQSLLDRLDRLRPDGPVQELGALPDGAVAALLAGAQALLFPSVAEGFGLPPVEAASLGVPVVCCGLPAIREILGDIPVYAEETDRYQWLKAIKDLSGRRTDQGAARVENRFHPPDWEQHFKTVLSLT